MCCRLVCGTAARKPSQMLWAQVAGLESPNGLDAIRRVSITRKNVKPKDLQLERCASPPFAGEGHRNAILKSIELVAAQRIVARWDSLSDSAAFTDRSERFAA